MKPIDRMTCRWMLVASIAGAIAVVLLGTNLQSVRGPTGLDLRTARPVFGQVLGHPVVSLRAAHAYQVLGASVPFALLVVSLALAGARLRDWVSALVALFGPASAVLLTELVCKPLFGRIAHGSAGFPSGHTAALTAFAASMVLVAARRWGKRGAVLGAPIGALLSGSMVLAVVRVHAHYMSDALGGVLLGATAVLIVALLVSGAFARFR